MKRLSPFRLWLYRIVAARLPETRAFGFKAWLLRWCGAEVGRNVRINSSTVVSGTARLRIGDNVWIGPGCRIYPTGGGDVSIGSNVDLAPEVMIVTGSHEVAVGAERAAGRGCSAPVVVGDGCWLCTRATVLKGVDIPPQTVVAAGAVVVRSVSDRPGGMWAGVPAKAVARA